MINRDPTNPSIKHGTEAGSERLAQPRKEFLRLVYDIANDLYDRSAKAVGIDLDKQRELGADTLIRLVSSPFGNPDHNYDLRVRRSGAVKDQNGAEYSPLFVSFEGYEEIEGMSGEKKEVKTGAIWLGNDGELLSERDFPAGLKKDRADTFDPAAAIGMLSRLAMEGWIVNAEVAGYSDSRHMPIVLHT